MNEQKPQKLCRYCNQLFEYKSAKAEYCSPAHKKAWQRARATKLDQKRKHRFNTSAFTFYLADACRRSGTVEVLPKTLCELEKLHTLYKLSLKANSYGEDDQFSLCHIFPIKHPHYVGSMYADNLCISYRDLNSKHSNTSVHGAGHRISRLNLSVTWLVGAEDSKSSVVDKIIAFFGEEFTATIAVKLKLQPTKRQASLDWLLQCNDTRVPSPTVLEEMSTVALTKLKAEISGASGGWLPDGINATEVFLSELKRLSVARPELEQVVEPWLEAMPDVVGLFHSLQWSRPKVGGSDAEYREALEPLKSLRQAQFDLLHGGSAEDFLIVLATYTASSNITESLVLPIAPDSVPILRDRSDEHYSSSDEEEHVRDWLDEEDGASEDDDVFASIPVRSTAQTQHVPKAHTFNVRNLIDAFSSSKQHRRAA